MQSFVRIFNTLTLFQSMNTPCDSGYGSEEEENIEADDEDTESLNITYIDDTFEEDNDNSFVEADTFNNDPICNYLYFCIH